MSEYTCPHCRQPIDDDEALLCHFCGESLGRTSNQLLGKIKGQRGKWLFVIMILVVIGSFLLLLQR